MGQNSVFINGLIIVYLNIQFFNSLLFLNKYFPKSFRAWSPAWVYQNELNCRKKRSVKCPLRGKDLGQPSLGSESLRAKGSWHFTGKAEKANPQAEYYIELAGQDKNVFLSIL